MQNHQYGLVNFIVPYTQKLPDPLCSNCYLSLVQVWGPSPSLPLPHLTIPPFPCQSAQTNKLSPRFIPNKFHHSIPTPAPLIICCTSLPLPRNLGSSLPLPKPPSSPHPPPLLISALSPPSMWVLLMITVPACGTSVCGTSMGLGMWCVIDVGFYWLVCRSGQWFLC